MSEPKSSGSVPWRHDPALRQAKAELEEHRRRHETAAAVGDLKAAQREVAEIERCFSLLGANYYSELEP